MYNQWLIYILYTTSYHFTSPHIARWRQKALLWELLRSGTGLMSRINWESMVSQTKTIAIKHHQTPGRKTNASWVLIWKTVRQPFPMQMMEPEKKQANASVSANHARKRAYVSVMIAGTEYKHGRQREKPTRWVARIKLLWSQILCFWPNADFRAASCTYYGHTVLMYPYVTFIIHDMFLIGKKIPPIPLIRSQVRSFGRIARQHFLIHFRKHLLSCQAYNFDRFRPPATFQRTTFRSRLPSKICKLKSKLREKTCELMMWPRRWNYENETFVPDFLLKTGNKKPRLVLPGDVGSLQYFKGPTTLGTKSIINKVLGCPPRLAILSQPHRGTPHAHVPPPIDKVVSAPCGFILEILNLEKMQHVMQKKS
jgi:hypothetical protein